MDPLSVLFEVKRGRRPEVVEVGRPSGGPLVFHRDCNRFDLRYEVPSRASFGESCYYTSRRALALTVTRCDDDDYSSILS